MLSDSPVGGMGNVCLKVKKAALNEPTSAKERPDQSHRQSIGQTPGKSKRSLQRGKWAGSP